MGGQIWRSPSKKQSVLIKLTRELELTDADFENENEFTKGLSYEKDVKTAITQIHSQKYPERLEHYKGNLILVGINYDKEIRNDQPMFKHHSCKIERA